jgi:hypothetical protein
MVADHGSGQRSFLQVGQHLRYWLDRASTHEGSRRRGLQKKPEWYLTRRYARAAFVHLALSMAFSHVPKTATRRDLL